MPGPSSDSGTSQERTNATAEEGIAGGQAIAQGNLAGQAAYSTLTDPRIQLATIEQRIQEKKASANALDSQITYYQDLLARHPIAGNLQPGWRNSLENLKAQKQALFSEAAQIALTRPILEKQVERVTQAEDLMSRAGSRIQGVLEGTDFGITPREQELITQGISGISQDVATTRGLNRTDVPVMQAIAPTVANALLSQANANRALFTGINQFQQGLGLSDRQLHLGLAGQNPAANIAGIYSNLRGSNFNTNTQQGYGGLDYVVQPLAALGGAAQGVGGAMRAYGGAKSHGGGGSEGGGD